MTSENPLFIISKPILPPDGFIASGGAGLYLRFSTIRLSPSYLGPSGTLLSIVV